MNFISLIQPDRGLSSWPQHWAACFGPAPSLSMSREKIDQPGWDSCDIVLVTGDAYVDHPSFGVAIYGRMLEVQDLRVGIIAQPDWSSKDDLMHLGKPSLFLGAIAGSMDSIISRYAADRRLRHDGVYTSDSVAGKHPDRAMPVYTQRCKEARKDIPMILGGIEAGLRRTAHYDYWSDVVRRSVLVGSKVDMPMLGNSERPLVEVAHRLAMGEPTSEIRGVRNTVTIVKEALPGWSGVDSTRLDTPGKIDPIPHPYGEDLPCADSKPVASKEQGVKAVTVQSPRPKLWEKTHVLLPSFEKIKGDKVSYTHASRILHHKTSPGCARALMQKHGDRYMWINPPTIPFSTEEMGSIFALLYKRVPYLTYGNTCIPAYKMICSSVNTIRDCFGGCSFCSITEHEGRITQGCSEDPIINEIEAIRDTVSGFTGVIPDLGGSTANMYVLRYKSSRVEQTCHHLSCVYSDICPYMDTNHKPTINLYRRAHNLKDTKKILITLGVRYDIVVEDPRYIKELATHHAGDYLKITPGHTGEGSLSKVMKPGMGSYDRFRELFDIYSRQAGKEQYLIPYFISTRPSTRNEDMVNLALQLKRHRFRLDQIQNFYLSPLASPTTMCYTGKNPLAKIGYKSEDVFVPKGNRQRRLHRALLRYRDPAD